MTRRSDLMCEDLFGCDHAPTIAISDDGKIVRWTCVCGEYSEPVELLELARVVAARRTQRGESPENTDAWAEALASSVVDECD